MIYLGKYSILDHIVKLYTDMLSEFFPEKSREDNEVNTSLSIGSLWHLFPCLFSNLWCAFLRLFSSLWHLFPCLFRGLWHVSL